MNRIESESLLEIKSAGGSPLQELGLLCLWAGFCQSGAGKRMCLSIHLFIAKEVLHMLRESLFLWLLVPLVLVGCSPTTEQPTSPASQAPVVSSESLVGRWDVTVKADRDEYPSWFELSKQGDKWEGQFVGQSGSARPIAKLSIQGGQLEFSLPKQYEKRTDDLVFKGSLSGDQLRGTTTSEDGKTLQWTAVRAPSLEEAGAPEWGEPIKLFNGKDLTGWRPRHAERNGWKVINGVLVNKTPSSDLITEQEFDDFKLHVEFNVPKNGNSGVYLRGRYEVQVEDIFGSGEGSGVKLDSVHMGGIYGFLAPTENAAKKIGEWQSYDVTLVGRRVTVVLNGKTIIDNQEIPGITGGALNSSEGTPGPIFLQGDHTNIAYRNIVITPEKK